jgi:para-nitrobenzyl esterase
MKPVHIYKVPCILSFALISTLTLSAAIPDPVRLDSGSVSGNPADDAGVRAFKGIPFAAPPLSDLRWRAPQPAAHWDGVRKAEQFASNCTTGAVGRGGGRG